MLNPYDSPTELPEDRKAGRNRVTLDIVSVFLSGAPVAFIFLSYLFLPEIPDDSQVLLIMTVRGAFLLCCLMAIISTVYSLLNVFSGRWLTYIALIINVVSIAFFVVAVFVE